VVAPLLALAPGAAQAATDPSDGGLWYYTATGMEQLHEKSTGAGITIAVIDSSVNLAAPDLVGADVSVREPGYCTDGETAPADSTDQGARHGTQMAALMVGTGAGADGEPGVRGVAPGAKVEVFTLGLDEHFESCSPADVSRAFQDAATSGADIISVSASLDLTGEDMLAAVRAGAVVVSSAGNEGYVDGTPAVFNGVVTVGTLTPDLQLAEGSPRGGGVDVVAPGAEIRSITADWRRYGRGTGSSDAAAFTSAALALAMSHYPDATPNQILQALIRTTDGTLHEPALTDVAWGYGTVNVRQLLDTDPSAFPDVNPFIVDGEDAWPTRAEIDEARSASAPTASPTPSSTVGPPAAAGAPAEDEDGRPETTRPWLVVLGAAVGVLVLGVGAAVVLVRRRSATGAPGLLGPDHGGQRG
jgi:hypothetical protein